MRLTRPRIWGLAAMFASVGLVLVIHLYLLMIEQGELWLERSYRNRWTFKDVPTRRGRVVDAQGRMLAEDVPVFGLLLHYRDFRRHHPVGTAVHGANLMMQSNGISDQWYRFAGGRHGPDQALQALLAMPRAWLLDGMPARTARDLRFYVVSTVSALTGRSWWTVYRELRDAHVEADATVGEALASHEDVEAIRQAYDERLAELGDIARRLAASSGGGGPAGRDLWQVLERWRAAWAIRPGSERIVRVVERNMPFDLAARIELIGERHPGFWPRPSVVRRRGKMPGRADLGSLEPILGFVTQLWTEDLEQIADRVDDTLGGEVADDLVPRDPDMPPELAEALVRDAENKVTAHLEIHGRTGRSGIEAGFDAELAGRPGLRLVERDRHARETGLWSTLDIAPGSDVVLTVDLALQALLEQSLDRLPGSGETGVALIDPRTGDVLALGGREPPGQESPWLTPATVWTGVGYVGSVAKPFVLLEQLAAIRAGRPCRDESTFEPCSGRFVAGGAELSCHAHWDAGKVGESALALSCNLYFFQAAQGLGSAGVERALARAGWVQGTGFEQPRVRGISRIGKAHVEPGGLLVRRAIGYGVNASALQVARAYAALATGVLPWLGLVAEDRSDRAVPLDVHTDDLAAVRDGLRACVTRGTARQVAGLEGLGVLAKTGTAEIAASTGDNNAWFAGYLTREEPSLAFAAVAYKVPDGEHGAEVAGALIAELLQSIRADPELRARYLPGVSER